MTSEAAVQGNAYGPGDDMVLNLVDEFAAFDMLPRTVRDTLNYCGGKYSANECWVAFFQLRVKPAEIDGRILETDLAIRTAELAEIAEAIDGGLTARLKDNLLNTGKRL